KPAQRLRTLRTACSPGRLCDLLHQRLLVSLPPPLFRLLLGGTNQLPGGFNSRCGPSPFDGAPGFRTYQELGSFRHGPKEPLKIMTGAPSPATKSFWNLGGLTSWQFGRAVFEQMIANNVFGRAAELAFYFLFALFRLIFFMTTLFGLFASYSV